MKVTLSPKQYEALPMRRSMKSKALTKGDIMGFLEDKGVDNVAFGDIASDSAKRKRVRRDP